MRKFTFIMLATMGIWLSMAGYSQADGVRFHVVVTPGYGYYGPPPYYYGGPYYSYYSPSWYSYHGPRYYYGHRGYRHYRWHHR